MKNYLIAHNNGNPIPLNDIPKVSRLSFEQEVAMLLANNSDRYPVTYFAHQIGDDNLQLFILIADQTTGEVFITSHDGVQNQKLHSLAVRFPVLTVFEREISERYGLVFEHNPWPKPVRYPHNRADLQSGIDNYPFYNIDSQEIHQVNVGPVHAGIIEPGVFRFLCEGESIFHLEIVLGFQHRGVEELIVRSSSRLRQLLLAEQIAGDTTVGHTTAMSLIMEQGVHNALIDTQRVVALEMERIAMHIADTGALCSDMAYQLGQVTCEALRTIVINTTQKWCGNRFGRTLIRPYGTNYHLSLDKIQFIKDNIEGVAKRYNTLTDNLFNTPSVLARLDEICELNPEVAAKYGAVGMAARSCGVVRDCRAALGFTAIEEFTPITQQTADLMARLKLRTEEVQQSCEIIYAQLKKLSAEWYEKSIEPDYDKSLQSNCLNFALVEGWRGMICHCAVTNDRGEFSTYKIHDPSVRNWLMLALSVRGAEISNFPLSNKSFNLSYCGNDL